MAEVPAEHLGQILQRRVQHPSGEAEFCVVMVPGFSSQVLCIRHGGRQRSPALCFVEVVGFLEGQQVDADRCHVSSQGFEQRGSVGGSQ